MTTFGHFTLQILRRVHLTIRHAASTDKKNRLLGMSSFTIYACYL